MARVLAVDDTPEQLLAIEMHLRGGEFTVSTTTDGRAALDLCRQQDFDLILLDVRMPGIDGFEVCRRLKADPRTAFVPVIFLTGHFASESSRQEAYALGAVDYVQKPIGRDELVARIRVMLRMQELRSRLTLENARLGRDLRAATRALEHARRDGADLRELLRLRGAEPPGIAVLDRELRVRFADEAAAALVAGLQPGADLGALGATGDALARLLAAGRGSIELPPAAPGGEGTRVRASLACAAGAAPAAGEDGFAVLRLEVAGPAELLREALRRREPAAAPTGSAGSTCTGRDYAIAGFVGRATAVREVAGMVDRLRNGRSTVLIAGESGTGKELVARALHFDGPEPESPFIPIHCGAISRDLVESELFGFEKGSFTGAQQRHDGLFAAADGGTIFLDEIAETPPEVQVKLLRVLQMGEIRPIGSNQRRIVDVRVVAATNRDLRQLVREGTFREDLFYRLEVVTLELPPLRERIEDLPLLIEHFLARCNHRSERQHRPVTGVSRGAMELLLAYPWPGNVRELENVLERAFALGVGDLLQEEDLPLHVQRGLPVLQPVLPPALPAGEPADAAGGSVLDLRARRAAAERAAFAQALASCEGDKAAAARALGLPRSTFYRRLRELGL